MNRLTIMLLIIITIYSVNNYEIVYTQTQPTKGDTKDRMAGITTKMVKYISGKDTVSAYLAEPEGNGPFPALIVIHEWWGLNEWIKNDADNFADSGYVALAIDLYHGKSADSPEEARKLSGGIQQEQAAMDLEAAYNYLNSMKHVDKNKIGSIGWCMGGGYSLRAALDLSGLSGCIICYGRLVNDVGQLKQIKCPLLGIFGEKDQGITPAIVKTFEDSLKTAGVKNKIIIYPGVSHAFMNPNNSGLHNTEATEKAWKEIYAFLDNNLK